MHAFISVALYGSAFGHIRALYLPFEIRHTAEWCKDAVGWCCAEHAGQSGWTAARPKVGDTVLFIACVLYTGKVKGFACLQFK